MRSTKERVIAVGHRIEEMKRKKQFRRDRMLGIFAVAICLTIILGISFTFPSLMADLPDGGYQYFGTAGSILDSRDGFGFVIIGLVSFVLGICVTILCNRIHLKSNRNRDNMEDNDG